MVYRGIVQRGNRLGTHLGFPTANIPFSESATAGIFSAWVRFDGNKYPAAVYANPKKGILEAHLFDFGDEIYGTEIEIELKEKIRDDRVFSSEDEARETIASDIARARESFNSNELH